MSVRKKIIICLLVLLHLAVAVLLIVHFNYSDSSIDNNSVAVVNSDSKIEKQVYFDEVKHDIGSRTAHDDGSLNEFQECYYVAHSSTSSGKKIESLQVGDMVYIDGFHFVVEGIDFLDWGNNDFIDSRNICGWDTVVMQTCFGNGFKVAYGHRSQNDYFGKFYDEEDNNWKTFNQETNLMEWYENT